MTLTEMYMQVVVNDTQPPLMTVENKAITFSGYYFLVNALRHEVSAGTITERDKADVFAVALHDKRCPMCKEDALHHVEHHAYSYTYCAMCQYHDFDNPKYNHISPHQHESAYEFGGRCRHCGLIPENPVHI